LSHRAWPATVVLTLLLAAPAAAGVELVSLKKIWDQAPHNAFSDLIRFRDRWHCAFREGEGHVGGEGKLRILVSRDGEQWESAALLAEPGVDLRDPKLSITPDGRLMILAGSRASPFPATAATGAPRGGFCQTATGSGALPGTRSGDTAFSYRGIGDGPRNGVLYRTGDGLTYEAIHELQVPGVSEVTLRFLPNAEMMALARREADNLHGWIGVSRPPYREWTWRSAGHRLGGPNFVRLPDGRLVAGSRSQLRRGRNHCAGTLGTAALRAAADLAQPRRLQLPRPDLAQEDSVDVLLLIARREGEHLPGQDPLPQRFSLTRSFLSTNLLV